MAVPVQARPFVAGSGVHVRPPSGTHAPPRCLPRRGPGHGRPLSETGSSSGVPTPIGSSSTMPSGGAVERRIVTVLFADLVGFTPLSERLDPEDVATVQDAYFGVVRETVARYGGDLELFFAAVFGAGFGFARARGEAREWL